jgi:glycolate oxidase FAD binding subunit
MPDNDISEKLCAQVRQACDDKQPLRISGGNSKLFYGHHVEGEELSVAPHTGITEYRASELVLTARSGTRSKVRWLKTSRCWHLSPQFSIRTVH